MNSFWSGAAEFIYTYSVSVRDRLVIYCHQRFSQRNKTIITDLYIAPYSSQHITICDFDFFLAFTGPLNGAILHIIVVNFNQAFTPPLNVFELTDPAILPLEVAPFYMELLPTTPI